MGRKNKDLLRLFVRLPWWVSVIVSASVYTGLKYGVPIIEPLFESKGMTGLPTPFKAFAQIAPDIAPWFGLPLLIPAPISALRSWRKRKLLDKQKSLDSIRALSWKEFEKLLAEAYRRQGYFVAENSSLGPDGGIDILLKKNGNVFLVQCKHWRSTKVGVRVVREMYGIMTDKGADGVFIITSGFFTQEAKNFASEKPIDLVEGNQLAQFVISVQKPSREDFQQNAASLNSEHFCPKCGCELILRITRKGTEAGENFWGCSSFPRCRFTQAYLG